MSEPVDGYTDPDELVGAFHGLFPDAHTSEIGWIEVRRVEAGRFISSPAKWDPRELESIEELGAIYGGGDYELFAKRPNGQVLTRSKVVLPGPPRSLDPRSPGAAVAAVPAPQQHATPVAQAPIDGGMTQMFFQMMMQQQQQTTQLITAFLTQGEARSREYVSNMQALHNSHAEAMASNHRQSLELFARLQQPQGGDLDKFMKGIEFAKDNLTEVVEEAAEGDPVLETMSELVGAAAQFSQARDNQKATRQQPPTPPPAPRPPGVPTE